LTESHPGISRRRALGRSATLVAAGGLALAGPARARPSDEAGEVSAVEDLMREHGVLRRILVVYREAAAALRRDAPRLDLPALGEAAQLFATFGEAYHERALEERHIFPAVRNAGGAAAGLVDTLLAQLRRGRELTADIKARCAAGGRGGGDLADALEAFARMYEAHTAFEDTVVFQAWKASMSEAAQREAAERFEAIEHAQFKGDGFEDAVAQVARIEARLGFGHLGRYTPPPARLT
jgi:hemerythrin-like domain-containing protein